jgi:hypothetical protein
MPEVMPPRNTGWASAALQLGDHRAGRLAEQGGDVVGRDAEAGLEAGDFGLGRLHQTFGLDDVEARGGTGFELELGELEGFLTRLQVGLGERDALLEVAGVDVGVHQILE